MQRVVAYAIVVGLGALGGVAGPAAATSGDEAALLTLANQSRVAARLAPVTSADALVAVARAHAQQMAAQGRLFHTPNLPQAMPGWSAGAEVIGASDVRIANWIGVVQSDFLASPVHRSIMLSGAFPNVGVAVAYNGAKTFVTEIYGRPGGAVPRPTSAVRIDARPARTRSAPAVRAVPRPPPPIAAAAPVAVPAPPPPAVVTTTTVVGIVTPVLFAPTIGPLQTAALAHPRPEGGWTWRMALVLLATAAAHGLHRRHAGL